MSKQQIFFLQEICRALIEILETYLIKPETPFSLNSDENTFWTLVIRKHYKIATKKNSSNRIVNFEDKNQFAFIVEYIVAYSKISRQINDSQMNN